MDVKRTIMLLEQAKKEIDQAISDLNGGDSRGALFALDDATTCVRTAQEDLRVIR